MSISFVVYVVVVVVVIIVVTFVVHRRVPLSGIGKSLRGRNPRNRFVIFDLFNQPLTWVDAWMVEVIGRLYLCGRRRS